jgi:hypothetical protein
LKVNYANLDRQQLVGVLVLLVSALFVAIRVVKPPYQTWIKRACIAGFLLAFGGVFVSIVAWLASL